MPPHNPSEEVSKARLNRMRGVEHHDRIDEELYNDYESEEAKRVRRTFYSARMHACMPIR